jgi:mono/diheme cytochrome c family protein/glucose/arabinose dehydrogenase
MLSRIPLVTLVAAVLITPIFAQNGDRAGEVQAPPPAHLVVPPAPALSPEEALKTIKVAPGFRVELVAAEPLVHDPVAVQFGPDGRLWVLEMRGYMPDVDGKGESEALGSVSVLEDTDGDGRMDKRTVFIDKLVLPRAIALVGDGLLIAEPPHLWFARDKNGDGVADEKVEVAADYGGTVNPEHTANGLMWGFDNWIYSANHTVRFRYQGDGKFTRTNTITRGQWGISQDDTGRIYYNSNSDPLRVDILPSGYLKRNAGFVAAGANVQLVPATLPVWPGRVTPGINRGYNSLNDAGKMYSVSAACAPVVYRGELFPKEFSGDVFICEPSGNLIKRIALAPADGAIKGRNAYEGTEFITSTDERFRPVNLTNGPDGALYVTDMYRGLIQHRTYVTSYLRKQVLERKLEQPIGMGRIYRVVPDGAPKAHFDSGLARATTVQLVGRLNDANGWVRDTAQRLLVERHDAAAVGPLVVLVSSSENPLGRLQALWTLDGCGTLDRAVVLNAIADRDPRVAAAAVRLSEKWLAPTIDAEIFARVASLANSPDGALRLQLALSLGEAKSAESTAILARLATDFPAQPYLNDAIISGLSGREEAFIASAVAAAKDSNTPPAVSVAMAASAVLKSSDAKRIEGLFAQAGDPSAPAWLHRALLDGVQRFVPRSPDGDVLMAVIPMEPKALIAMAAAKDGPDSARATQLLASLKWPGKPGLKTAPVVALTPAQQALFDKGAVQFATLCAACHQPTGQGLAGLAPPLVNSRLALGDDRVLARIVLAGKTQENMTMPAMKTVLNDEAIAGVLTYIRRSWGHEAGPVSLKVVADARAAVASREEPWNDEDLAQLQRSLAPRRATKKR